MNYSFPSTMGTAKVVTTQRGFTFTIYAVVAAIVIAAIAGLWLDRSRLSKALETKDVEIASIKKDLEDAKAMIASVEKENSTLREQITLIQDVNQVKEEVVKERSDERKEIQTVKTRIVYKLEKETPPVEKIDHSKEQQRSESRISSLWELYLTYEGETNEETTSSTRVPNSMPNDTDSKNKRSNYRNYIYTDNSIGKMQDSSSTRETELLVYDYGSEGSCTSAVQYDTNGITEAVRLGQTSDYEDTSTYSKNDQRLQLEAEV